MVDKAGAPSPIQTRSVDKEQSPMTHPLRQTALESFLIAGRQMIRPICHRNLTMP